jgi:hypothetical protein
MINWESPLTRSSRMPSDRAIASPKMSTSYSAMLLVALKLSWTAYRICSPSGNRRTILALHPSARAKQLKCKVQWGLVKVVSKAFYLWCTTSLGEVADSVHSAMKSTRTRLLIAWHGVYSRSNSASSAAHLVKLLIAIGL